MYLLQNWVTSKCGLTLVDHSNIHEFLFLFCRYSIHLRQHLSLYGPGGCHPPGMWRASRRHAVAAACWRDASSVLVALGLERLPSIVSVDHPADVRFCQDTVYLLPHPKFHNHAVVWADRKSFDLIKTRVALIRNGYPRRQKFTYRWVKLEKNELMSNLLFIWG